MPKAAYIHIPFCEHICYYCDFNKYLMKGQPVWDYLQALRTEMKTVLRQYPSDEMKTIFVGGGTPTTLDQKQMAYFLESVNQAFHPVVDSVEFTMEANPGNLDREKLVLMKEAGVNRLSLGVQTFDDKLLSAIGRTHKNSDVFRTVELAKEAGFTNLSIDLMFRLPGQTMEALKESLAAALSLDIRHLSIYSLQIEPRTIFYNRMRKGTLQLPNEDEEADMFEVIIDSLEENGFHQYEISNFARAGYESRHNRVYWQNEDYYGFGAGAHSYINGIRRVNAGWTKRYIRLIRENGTAFVDEHSVSIQEKMEDEMFLGLRKAEGISKRHFQKRFGRSVEEVFSDAVDRLLQRRLIIEKGDRIFLTKRGLFLGNEVFQEFIK
jgi:oxygen-independent coproporphyrinogen-3 oxidase